MADLRLYYVHRRLPGIAGILLTAVLTLHAQRPLKAADVESCMMAQNLKTAKAAVVSIATYSFEDKDAWSRIGSGWIYPGEGLIVTRQSVVMSGDSIDVAFANGMHAPAWVLDCNPMSQIAILKIDTQLNPDYHIQKTVSLEEGDCVALLGNSLGVFPSVTLGHVIGFQENGYFLFDGSIPPGNSGGPIFNHDGELVGMLAGRKAMDSYTDPVGVAVPSAQIESALKQFLSYAKKEIGWMGLYVTNLAPGGGNGGVRVLGVIPDSPADIAAISRGDTLMALEGKPILDADDLARQVQLLKPSRIVQFDVLKKNQIKQFQVEVGRLPFKK